MWFWGFMLVMVMLIPVTMIGFGKYFLKNAPKEINPVFGYRTSRSMKNRDTWEFAHRLCGKIWYRTGWILLPLSVIPMMFVTGKDTDTVGNLGAVISLVQIIPLIGSIIPVEHALKKAFDENGMPRTHQNK